MADVPSGTGMGSSGAFTVALLKAPGPRAAHLDHPGRRWPSPRAEIEIDILDEPCGKQDPYVAAHGGICAYTFNPDGTRRRRAAGAVARDAAGAARADAALLHRRGPRRLGRPLRPGQPDEDRATTRCSRTCTGPRRWASRAGSCWSPGDLFAYAELMHEHWLNKRKRSPGWPPSASTSCTPWRGAAA